VCCVKTSKHVCNNNCTRYLDVSEIRRTICGQPCSVTRPAKGPWGSKTPHERSLPGLAHNERHISALSRRGSEISCDCRTFIPFMLVGRNRVSELRPLTGLLFIRHMASHGGIILTGENRRTRRKTGPTTTLPTTKPTWTDTAPNPGLRGERPAHTSTFLRHRSVAYRK
jgi:hypothetical protein